MEPPPAPRISICENTCRRSGDYKCDDGGGNRTGAGAGDAGTDTDPGNDGADGGGDYVVRQSDADSLGHINNARWAHILYDARLHAIDAERQEGKQYVRRGAGGYGEERKHSDDGWRWA